MFKMVVSNQDPDVLEKIQFKVVDLLPGQNIRDVIEVTPLEELRRVDPPQGSLDDQQRVF